MNFPCFVLPYQRSPSRWYTPESRFTHTMPFCGGSCACVELLAPSSLLETCVLLGWGVLGLSLLAGAAGTEAALDAVFSASDLLPPTSGDLILDLVVRR